VRTYAWSSWLDGVSEGHQSFERDHDREGPPLHTAEMSRILLRTLRDAMLADSMQSSFSSIANCNKLHIVYAIAAAMAISVKLSININFPHQLFHHLASLHHPCISLIS
jgi:hypothetical protein